jgi:thioredoxin reductase (NADPH)
MRVLTRTDVASFPVFAGLAPDVLDRMCERAADITLSAGEYLVHEGEIPAFYVVVSGKLEVTKHVGEHEQVLGKRKRADFFGEVPLLLGSTVFANMRAREESRVMRLDAADFHALVTDESSFAAVVFRAMSRHVGEMQQLATETPPPPVLVVGKRFDTDCHDLRDFLSRNHIAFEFLASEDPLAAERIGDAKLVEEHCPVVRFLDGTVMTEPPLREVARKLDLRTEPDENAYDVAIVGGGPAGLAAAVYGASEGLRTILIERQAPGGQAGTSSRRFGAEVVVTRSVEAIAIDDDCRLLTLDGGTRVRSRAVVLAMGVAWRRLDVEGVDRFVGRGVYYGAARTEAQAMRGRHVVLVGGGNSAGQAALYFTDYAESVTILVREETLAASMSAYLIEQLETKDCVHIEYAREIVAMHGDERLETIDVRDNTRGSVENRPVDGVFVFIGADAETDWLPDAIARDERGYILTGKDGARLLETSVPGIFAAGDVRHGSVKRVAAGVGEGSMAIAFVHAYLEASAGAKTPTPA